MSHRLFCFLCLPLLLLHLLHLHLVFPHLVLLHFSLIFYDLLHILFPPLLHTLLQFLSPLSSIPLQFAQLIVHYSEVNGNPFLPRPPTVRLNASCIFGRQRTKLTANHPQETLGPSAVELATVLFFAVKILDDSGIYCPGCSR